MFATLEISVTRRISIPDGIRVERFRRTPELGPALLFFSGGSAMAPLARRLIDFTHNSIHLITPFDSGGSSATLREAFHMPAVGDIRNRLMSLADQSVRGNPDVFHLFAYRLPTDNSGRARTEFENLLDGHHPLIAAISDPLRKIIRNHFRLFAKAAPEDFNYCGASVGNLILTGGYLNNERHLDPVAFLFSRLVEARGVVRPVVNRWAHLMAECDDGSRIIGQKEITDRCVDMNAAPIRRISLVEELDAPTPVSVPIRKKIRNLIRGADAIVYPMGSFFTSLLANLLPEGIGAAVVMNGASKVFVPNTGSDPETMGLSLAQQVEILLDHLKRTAPADTPSHTLLDFVLVDRERGQYAGDSDLEPFLLNQGVRMIDTELISSQSAPYIDEELLVPILLSLV